MSEEQNTLAEVDSAQAPEATAVEDQAVEEMPEVEAEAQDQDQEEPKAEKTFTQDELDKAIGKRLAREQRKWEREQQARATEEQARARATQEIPPADEFDSPEAYAEALAERKAQELIAKRDAALRNSEIMEAYHDREEEAMDKYDDFKQVAYNPSLPITDVMADTIRTSDIGPEIAYYLGSNMREAARIAKMTPYAQAKEIGKIEVKLADAPPAKKTTSAPPPITPVANRGGSSPSYDTTDPRSVKSMSTSEWIAAERERQRKKWEAQHR